jgi:hypothetical protein
MSMTWQQIQESLQTVFKNASARGDTAEAQSVTDVIAALREKEAEAGNGADSKAAKLARISGVADLIGGINL